MRGKPRVSHQESTKVNARRASQSQRGKSRRISEPISRAASGELSGASTREGHEIRAGL
jgi:hypothetical protein